MIIYPEDQLPQFCVLLQCQGQRTVLNDDFKLLQLRGHLQKTRICVTRLETIVQKAQNQRDAQSKSVMLTSTHVTPAPPVTHVKRVHSDPRLRSRSREESNESKEGKESVESHDSPSDDDFDLLQGRATLV